MEITLSSLDDLAKAAESFLKDMQDKRVFAFYGNMGAGKTTFIKALCEAMGVEDEVNSPTFALVNEYYIPKTDRHVYHFDFYRINKEEEVYDIGYEDYFYSDSYCFIEWPELIENLLPEETVRVHIAVHPDKTRTIFVQ